MRGVASYVIAGFLVGMALNFVAPLGFSPVAATQSAINDVTLQSVDRSHKADRAAIMTVGKSQPETVGKSQSEQQSPKMLTGCDPAFSPLSVSARANFARICAA
jgi:hypothetical protein